MMDQPQQNTDKKLWDHDGYSLAVTLGGGINIGWNGLHIVKPAQEWHRLANQPVSAAVVEPREYALVPREATPDMVLAGAGQFEGYRPFTQENAKRLMDDVKDAWEEMIAAAPIASATPEAVRPDKPHCVYLRAVIAKGGSNAAIRLAAQLDGVPPCPDCDYVIQHCRCEPAPSTAASAGEAHWCVECGGITYPCPRLAREAYQGARPAAPVNPSIAQVTSTDTPSHFSIITPGLPEGTLLYGAPTPSPVIPEPNAVPFAPVAWQCRPARNPANGRLYEADNPWQWRDCDERDFREQSYNGSEPGSWEFRELYLSPPAATGSDVK